MSFWVRKRQKVRPLVKKQYEASGEEKVEMGA